MTDLSDYQHVYHGIPTKEQRTCRNCGETLWFDTSVSDRWPHYECGAGEGFSKDEALEGVPEEDYFEIEPAAVPDMEVNADVTVRL